MWLYKRVKGEKQLKELQSEEEEKNEEYFSQAELEQAFDWAYRSYRINRRSRINVDTFFDQIRQNLIDLMNSEIQDLGSIRVQMTTWIRFMVEVENENRNVIGVDRVEKALNSQMTDIFQGSDFNEIVNGMFTHMKTHIKNLALENSRLRFDDVLFIDINFYQLNSR